jgi:hypothetical protein
MKKKLITAGAIIFPAVAAVLIVWGAPKVTGAYTDPRNFSASATDHVDYYVSGTHYKIGSSGVFRYTPDSSGNWVSGSAQNVQISAADLNTIANALGKGTQSGGSYTSTEGTVESMSQKFGAMVK